MVLLHIALYLIPQNVQDLDQVLEHKDRTVSLHCCRTLIALHSFFHIFTQVKDIDFIDTTREILQSEKLKQYTMRFV